jgi:hypothetical protein
MAELRPQLKLMQFHVIPIACNVNQRAVFLAQPELHMGQDQLFQQILTGKLIFNGLSQFHISKVQVSCIVDMVISTELN